MGWNVLQHNRLVSSGRFQPFHASIDSQIYIVLRDPVVALNWAETHPHSQVHLWLHDLCGLGSSRAKVLSDLLPQLIDYGISIITVSDFHKAQLQQVVVSAGFSAVSIHRIYNPVVVPELPPVEVDNNQLVFLSSPHKGVETAIKVFAAIRRKFSSMRLLVANPGYFPSAFIDTNGVTSLGPLARSVALAHAKASLCMLIPNYVYPETFGLALAECNAVGTPVLTHDLGAAAEILADERQIIRIPRGRMRLDALQKRFRWASNASEYFYSRFGGYDDFIERISAWRSGSRPRVRPRDEFSLSTVVTQWRQFIEG